METIIAYSFYLVISLAVTIWVARTLHRSGRVFLVDAFRGREELADSVNHLLVVGFYLINVGYISFALRYGDKPKTIVEAFDFLSTKIGLVLLALGAMHFLNLYVLSRLRNRAGVVESGPNETISSPA